MGQVTIYLDDEAEARMRASAKAEGVPASRWVSRLIREKTDDQWPEEVKRLAGAWSDFPEADELREGSGEDVERESL